jgi:tetratricopeptide (TPR) repeat protein
MIRRKKSFKKHPPQARSGAFTLSALSLGVSAGAVLIAVAAFIVYLPCIRGEFIMDDDVFLTENPLIHATDGPYRFWCTSEAMDFWPATSTTLWIEWRLWERNPTGYHVTSLILHVVESLLIWIILRRLTIPGAFFTALIFAVHPVNVESVAWISQRKNVMAMLFFLLSILWYLKFVKLAHLRLAAKLSTVHRSLSAVSSFILHPSSFNLWYCLSLAAFVLAMLGKGSAAVLPVLLLGIVWWLRPLERRDLARASPFFVAAAVLAGVNVWFQTHGTEIVIRSANFAERLLGAGGVVWFYLYKALLPVDLAFVYSQWHIELGNPLWWLPILAALAVTAVLWQYRKGWSRPLLFAWGFFCVALAPVLGFVDVGFMNYSLVADHYQHIAIIGVIALASAGFGAWQKRTQGLVLRIAPVMAVAAFGIFTFLTWRQSECYHDNITLYQTTLAINPECCVAHNNLGVNLAEAGQLPDAIEHYQQALRLKPNNPEAHNNLGNALVRTGRPDEAVEHYRQALRLKPDYPEAHDNLIYALAMTGKPEQAIEYYGNVLRLNRDNPEAHYILGNVLAHAGRQEEAIEHYQQALRLKPNNPEAHNNLGKALVKTGRPDEAVDHYRQALRLQPDYPEAHDNLIDALAMAGKPEQAIEYYGNALRLNPNNSEAHFILGNVLAHAGREAEAIEHYQRAVALAPKFAEAHVNLGNALTRTGRFDEAIDHYQQALRLAPEDNAACVNLISAYARAGRSSEALATAEKAVELKRVQGQTALAKQIEDWLKSYRAGLSNPQNTPSPAQSAPPPP